MPFQIHRYISL